MRRSALRGFRGTHARCRQRAGSRDAGQQGTAVMGVGTGTPWVTALVGAIRQMPLSVGKVRPVRLCPAGGS